MAEKALKTLLHREERLDDLHVNSADREQESWLLVYLDVMTLLLVMLVVLLAFSSKVVGIGSADPRPLLGQDGILPGTAGLLEGEPAPPSTPVDDSGTAGPARFDPLEGLELDTLGDEFEVIVDDATVRLRISSEILFPSGQAQLSESGLAALDRLAGVIGPSEHRIAVEGHTDDVPIQTERFPSNWELSTSRATSVVRHLVERGISPSRLRAIGYADTRPIKSGGAPEARSANRRVDLIMEATPR